MFVVIALFADLPQCRAQFVERQLGGVWRVFGG